MSLDPQSTPPEPVSPHFTVLPPAIPSQHGTPPSYSQETGGTHPGNGPGLPPILQSLAKNPLVLAGGAVVAGVVLSRLLATPSARKYAGHLAAEALKHLKPAAAGAAGMAGTAAAGSILEKGVEKYGPQIVDYAKKMLADMVKKKE